MQDITVRDTMSLDTMLADALVRADALGLDLVAIHLEQARSLLGADMKTIAD